MGVGNSQISVTFDSPQPMIYLTGETICGQVHFDVADRTTRADDMVLTLTGDVGHTTTRTVRIQNGQMERKTDYHEVRIYGQKILLNRSAHNVGRGGADADPTMLEPGHYTYPFAIRLPEILPPTIHPEDYPFVRYNLQVLLEKKWYAANARHRYPIRIHPRVNLLSVSNSQSAVKFGTTRKDISIKGVLQRAGLVPGEQTMLTLDIHNPGRFSIKRIDVCLVQRYVIEQCRRRLELIRLPVPNLNHTDDERIQAACPFVVPFGIAPSYNYRSTGKNKSAVHVYLHYDLKLEVKARGLFSDFDLQVPVTIGTTGSARNIRALSEHDNGDTMSTLDIDIADDEEIPPPTYESVYDDVVDSDLQ